jgi:hypothetical protein
MSLIDAYGARREAEVMQETWGHLAPNPNREYTGSVLFTHGAYGDLTAISVDFDGLDDSPWFYEHLHDWFVNAAGFTNPRIRNAPNMTGEVPPHRLEDENR